MKVRFEGIKFIVYCFPTSYSHRDINIYKLLQLFAANKIVLFNEF